ncbi:MAG: selenide, water dikinase SelD [Polyangiales bacterium]
MLRGSAFASLPGGIDPGTLVGLDAPDDAAVVRVPGASIDTPALVLTTDFFTPIVDDPRMFGRIAAINAISDVYAMGGVPRFALNLAGFPTKTLPLEVLGEILAGGAEACREEGVLVLGGHTIDDPEPKFGLCVIGTVEPAKVWRKRGAQLGDRLVLTKALGTGVIATAVKRDVLTEADPPMVAAIASMSTSNRRAAEAARPLAIHAGTDVTGYGLLGHLLEMLGGDGCTVDASLDVAAVPLLPQARALAEAGHVPGGSKANLAWVKDRCEFAASVDPTAQTLLADAQTSGGLLLSMPAADAESLVKTLGAPAAIIGTVVAGSGRVRVG